MYDNASSENFQFGSIIRYICKWFLTEKISEVFLQRSRILNLPLVAHNDELS